MQPASRISSRPLRPKSLARTFRAARPKNVGSLRKFRALNRLYQHVSIPQPIRSEKDDESGLSFRPDCAEVWVTLITAPLVC